MVEIITTERATLNSIRLWSTDCVDQSIKVLSNFGESQRLPKNDKEDFSWNRDGLFVVKNLSEQDCTLHVGVIRCTGDLIVMRSSHQSARTFRAGDSAKRLLKAGESLTFRADNAMDRGRSPGQTNV
jgi:hypothetical protein